MLFLKPAAKLSAACAECSPRRNAEGEIVGLNLGLLLTNATDQDIDYEVLTLGAHIDGCHEAATAPAEELRGDIPAGTTRLVHQSFTLDGPLSLGTVLRGTMQALLRYGLPRGLQSQLSMDFAVTFKAGSSREISAFAWRPI